MDHAETKTNAYPLAKKKHPYYGESHRHHQDNMVVGVMKEANRPIKRTDTIV